MVPAIDTQDSLVITRKLPWRLQFPETARACLQEVVVEQALVVTARPPQRVQLGQMCVCVYYCSTYYSVFIRCVMCVCLSRDYEPRPM